MAKAKIFLSSTCYDLSLVRHELDIFLQSHGCEVINSEAKDFGVTPGLHSHRACLEAVAEADYLLLMIGKRSGGVYIGSEKSITNEEFNHALKLGIPVIVCVDRSVCEYRRSYSKNPKGDHSHIVDDVKVFHFIDYVSSGHSDNWLHQYSNINDIKHIVCAQFSHYLHEYSKGLRSPRKVVESEFFVVPFPDDIGVTDEDYSDQEEATAFRNGIKGLHDVVSKIVCSDIKPGAKIEKLKQLWVLGRYGEADEASVSMPMDNFKQYAWSSGRTKRINRQFEDFDIKADFSIDEQGADLYIIFDGASEETPIAWAMQKYIKKLLSKYDADDALEIFSRCDLRVYQA